MTDLFDEDDLTAVVEEEAAGMLFCCTEAAGVTVPVFDVFLLLLEEK